jgi:predicted alpha/beta superfamily hydrolase
MTRLERSLALLGAGLVLAGAAQATTVRVHYAAGKEGIRIRADKGAAGWSQGVPATPDAGPLNVWSFTWPDALGDIAMKPALGADKVSIGGVYKLAAGSTVDIYPFFGAPFGKIVEFKYFASPELNNKRSLHIYLPPSYGENTAKRYPVVYMQDGQNLFDARSATYGVAWRVGETVNRLVATGVMDEAIVVGIDSTPDRIEEYTPCCDPQYGGGRLDAYDTFVVQSVKPYIDRTYRTIPGKDATAIMGSSLGGLAAFAIAQRHPATFSSAASLSGAFWWNGGMAVTRLAERVPVRFYLDAGTRAAGTRDDELADALRMRDALLAKGYKEGSDLMFYKAEGARRDEAAWGARVDKPLTWFFPWGSTRQ